MSFDNPQFVAEWLRPKNSHLFIARYTPSDDAATDRSNALTALAAACPLFDAAWNAGDFNALIKGTSDTGEIASVANGDGATQHPTAGGYTEGDANTDIVITLAADHEASASVRTRYPAIEFQGKMVPPAHIKHFGNGNATGDNVIILDKTKGYTNVAADYKVTLWHAVPGVQAMDLGGLDLPQTTVQEFELGVSNAVYSEVSNDGASGSGSVTYKSGIGRTRIASGLSAAAEIFGFPGEWIEWLHYGSVAAAGQVNEHGYIADGKVLVLAKASFNPAFPNLRKNSAADVGKVFAKLKLMFQARVTNWGNDQNETAEQGSGQAISQQVQYTWARSGWVTFKTIA